MTVPGSATHTFHAPASGTSLQDASRQGGDTPVHAGLTTIPSLPLEEAETRGGGWAGHALLLCGVPAYSSSQLPQAVQTVGNENNIAPFSDPAPSK